VACCVAKFTTHLYEIAEAYTKIKQVTRSVTHSVHRYRMFKVRGQEKTHSPHAGNGVQIPAQGRYGLLLHRLRRGLDGGEFRRIELAVLVGIGLGELGFDLG
jgi:hypothetical protein